MHLRYKDQDQTGAVMVIFAISMVVLFAFVAIAVDTAHAYVERRDSQSTADVAAIGGGLALIGHTGTNEQKATSLVDEVMRIAEANLGPGLDWAGCTDPSRPSEFTEIASDVFLSTASQYTACISWSSDYSKIRVQIPVRNVSTYFAGVIGFDTIAVAAFAEVEAVVEGGGGVLPFGVLAPGAGGLVCLKTGPKFPDDCDSNDEGNFGFLDFKKYGNGAMSTVADCNLSPVTALKQNIAHGVDHDLEPAPSTPTDHQGISNAPNIYKEDVQCSSTAQKIQAVKTETGNKQKVIIDGFVNGSGGFPGRLTRSLLLTPPYTTDFAYNGTDIDDVGLWEFLTSAGITACGSPTPTTEQGIIDCLKDVPPPEGGFFNDDIRFSSRLAQVPVLHQTEWPSGSKYVSFERFSFVYIQTIYGGCKNNGACSLEIEPGVSGVKKVTAADPVAVTAILIENSALPIDILDYFGAPKVTTYALTR